MKRGSFSGDRIVKSKVSLAKIDDMVVFWVGWFGLAFSAAVTGPR